MAFDFALVALDGAYHSSIGALVDSFLIARDRVEHIFAGEDQMRMETRLHILSQDGGPVTLGDGRPFAVDGLADGDEPLAFIWLPAFRAGGRTQLEQRIAQAGPLIDWLRRQSEQGAVIGASGAASTLLMAGGFTSDIAVPVARALQPLTRTLFPRQPFEERFGLVDHGHLLIGNGMGSDLQLIIRVLERMISPDIARWLSSIVGQDYEEKELLAPDPLVARAQLWIEQRFTASINMANLAQHLSTSPATLNRRFHKALGLSPKAYVGQLRFQAAVRMLDKSTRSVDRIAQLVGYSDSRLFRAMFRQHAGMTASEWRARGQAR
ncbi:transcriptional regulator, AraC family with amidase-like domain [Sphingobium faniae]|nr:transcriptional regulator, AraC family with amidase-like domain [Sphingobium faniae]